MTRDVAQLRAKYRRTGIDRGELADDAVTQFRRWYEEWISVSPYDATAVVLATADATRGPSARWMRLASVDQGFVFFTNHESRKATDLAVNPRAELCFGWLELARQVRVAGPVTRLTDLECDDYFASQPRDVKLLAWASDQRSMIPDRAALERLMAEVKARFSGEEVPRPHYWGGYRLAPDELEFWQGRADNLQDRFRYRRPSQDAPWVIQRLAP